MHENVIDLSMKYLEFELTARINSYLKNELNKEEIILPIFRHRTKATETVFNFSFIRQHASFSGTIVPTLLS
jgi:hypothetical protein